METHAGLWMIQIIWGWIYCFIYCIQFDKEWVCWFLSMNVVLLFFCACFSTQTVTYKGVKEQEISKNKTQKGIAMKVSICNACCGLVFVMSTYLLPLCCRSHNGPLSAYDPHVVAAFSQCQWLVHGVSRNGSIQVVSVETIRGRGNLLGRSATVPPGIIAVVSSRGAGPWWTKY